MEVSPCMDGLMKNANVTRASRIGAAGSAVLLGAACGTGSDSRPELLSEVRDSAGVTIVENARPATGSRLGWPRRRGPGGVHRRPGGGRGVPVVRGRGRYAASRRTHRSGQRRNRRNPVLLGERRPPGELGEGRRGARRVLAVGPGGGQHLARGLDRRRRVVARPDRGLRRAGKPRPHGHAGRGILLVPWSHAGRPHPRKAEPADRDELRRRRIDPEAAGSRVRPGRSHR